MLEDRTLVAPVAWSRWTRISTEYMAAGVIEVVNVTQVTHTQTVVRDTGSVG